MRIIEQKLIKFCKNNDLKLKLCLIIYHEEVRIDVLLSSEELNEASEDVFHSILKSLMLVFKKDELDALSIYIIDTEEEIFEFFKKLGGKKYKDYTSLFTEDIEERFQFKVKRALRISTPND